MYGPTISVSFSSNRMSLETLKVLLKCGLRPCVRKIRETVAALAPTSLALTASRCCLCPVWATGPGGYRLGYGGGFYDRTTLQPRPVTVGLGYGWLPDMEPEPHDIPLNALLNTKGVVWPV